MSHFWRQSVRLLYSHRVYLFKESTKFHFKSFRRPNSIRMSSKQTTILSFFKRSDANDRQISHQLSDSPAKETRKRKSSADGHKLEAKKEDLPEKESNQETKSQLESNSDSDSNSPLVKRRFRRIMVSESEDESNSCSADAKETQLKEEPKESKAEMKVNEIKSKLEDDVNEAEESVNRGKQRKQKKSSPKTNGKAKSSTKSGKEETESRQDSKVESKEEPQTKVNGKKGEKPIIEESKIMDAVDYQPSKSDYDPVEDAPWKKNEKVPYLALAKTFEEIENVSSRLKMIEILGNYLWSVKVLSPDDLLPSVYLCLNKLGPDYEGVELGIGDSLVVKALAEATGRKPEQIKAEVEKKGDLGLVAESSRGNQRVMFQPPKLTVKAVFDKLKEIALMSGHSVMSKKVEKIKILLVACRHCEARYLVRSLTGKLRIGLAEQSLLVALARCVLLSDDQRRKRNSDAFKAELDRIAQLIKNAYCQCPNYEKVLEVILNHDVDELPQRCQITPGIPLKPMLAHPTKDISEILRRFENSEFTCEYKYDGERAQVHVVDKEHISVYSRSQENYTAKYPDIASRMSESMKEETKSCILDCEAVAWDTEAKQILPFQVLSTRKRKDVKEEDIKVKVCLFAFDLLYLNGESLISKPLRQRRELLRSHFEPIDGRFMFATSKDFSSIDDVPEFLEESIKGKCEGLMVKCLDHEATYEIAKRSHSWLKLKKDYIEGVGDTIDVVVIGAYYGKGKRTGNYGGYLLAVYDDENEEFQSVCKLGTGFKDEDLEKHTAYFKDHIIPGPKSYYSVDDSLKPDVWFDVSQVWEIKAADLSVSPVYRAAYGMIESEKGISLRFPRFLRIRDDKKPEDSTTAAQIAEMYESQEQVKKSSDGKNINDD